MLFVNHRQQRASTPLRLTLVAVVAVLGALAFGVAPGHAQTPRSMVALGDSTTVGLRACGVDAACPESSWATGSDPAIDSHATRLGRLTAGFSAQNVAVAGVRAEDLARQAAEAVAHSPEYVTILIGTEDVCSDNLRETTRPPLFRRQIALAMNALTRGAPNARIFLSSIPDPGRLRELFRSDATALATWAANGSAGTCANFLQDANSDDPRHDVRRQVASNRLSELNFQLADVCAQHAKCVWDDYAVTNWDYDASHISTVDYFSFTREGQATLAALTFPRAFPGTALPPGATATAPGSLASGTTALSGALRFPAKLKVKSASIRSGKLNALLSITGRATGTLRVEYHAAGVRKTFNVPVGPAGAVEKNVKVAHTLSSAQRRASTGILTVTYVGNEQVHADLLRSRAANRASRLKRTTLSFSGARLKIAGTVAPQVSGVVRLRVTYAGANGALEEWLHNAKITRGRWSVDEQLPAAAGADVNAYLTMQFTGDRSARGGPHRGEQDGKGLSNLSAG